MNESELAQTVMQQESTEGTWKAEVHYNEYGSRGVVDLVKIQTWEDAKPDIRIFELKSESAVKQSTGANEIIRQFNRHRDSFFAGSDYRKRDYSSISFLLVFEATPYCIEHIRENWVLYKSTQHRGKKPIETRIMLINDECGQYQQPESETGVLMSTPFARELASESERVEVEEGVIQ